MERNGFSVEDCLVRGFQETCVIYEPIMDNNRSSPISSSSNDEDPPDNYKLDEESWDSTYIHNDSTNMTDKMVNTENNIGNNNANCSNVREETPRKSTLKGNSQQKIFKTVAIDESSNNRKLKNDEDSNTYDELNKMYPAPSTSTSVPHNTPTNSSDSSTHQSRRKRKRKHDCEDETMTDEMKNITKNLVYNTLNAVDISDSSCDAKSPFATNPNSISNISSQSTNRTNNANDLQEINETGTHPRKFIYMVYVQLKHVDLDEATSDMEYSSNEDKTSERELAHASREVLFDPNSEASMLEDFNTNDVASNWEESLSDQSVTQPQVVLLGINVNNNEDDVLSKPL